MRALVDRRFLEACALQDTDTDQMAWRPVEDIDDLIMGEPDLVPRPRMDGPRVQRLPTEARRALALWTRYSLACLELLDRRTGDA